VSDVGERRAFLLPDLGEGLTQAELVQWLVAVGDVVAVDQPVAEVETEKALVQLPCPYAGTVAELHGKPGDTIAVGAPLITIDVAAALGGSGKVLVGYGTPEPGGRRRRRAASPPPAATAPSERPRTTPPVRKRARDLGVDLAAVTGSGPGGIITRADIEAAAESHHDGEREPERMAVRGVRKAVADRLATAHGEIPQANTWIDADATELLAWRRSIAHHPDGVAITPLALILRICVAGLERFPVLNASFDGNAGEIVLHRAVHIGVAVQTERGLVVPVIRDANARNALELSAELERLSAGARNGSLPAADLRGSTFTVSNFGIFGVDGGIALINPPEAGILGVGRITDRPWIVDGAVVARPVVQLSLGFDHRVCDGRDAAGFLRFVADGVEAPGRLFATL
jgi:pyruvate dehydrogenase E2 component (dihydrolipoamide acetyltransferase)